MKQTECCPHFDPPPWMDITFEWNNRIYIRDKIFALFYIPINFGGVIRRMNEKVE